MNWVRFFTPIFILVLSILCVSLASAATTQNFTSNTTWTVPAGITNITVSAWGGGGAGVGATVSGSYGGGGGGAFASSVIKVTPAENLAVMVAGISIATTGNGPNGTPSYVNWQNGSTAVYADFGRAGVGTSGGSGGLASSSTGTTKYNGGWGGTPGGNYGGGGGGGAGTTGNGGNASASAATAGTGTSLDGGNGGDGISNANGNNGTNYGGGGGSVRRTSGTRIGGSGAQGLVRISYDAISFSDASINQSTTAFIGQMINHNISINTTGTIGYYKFAWNASGAGCDTWANVTTVNLSSGSDAVVGVNATIPSACAGKRIGWRIWANNTAGNYNSSDIQSYDVFAYGSLNVTIASPSSDINLSSGNVFYINATIRCYGGSGALCGNVTVYARYNASSANPDTMISVSEASPLYVNSNSPNTTNPVDFTYLNDSMAFGVSWLINYSGAVNSSYYIDIYANSSVYGSSVGANDTVNRLIQENGSGPVSSCIYSGAGDWVVTEHCQIINTVYNVSGTINISRTAWLNVSGSSIINATRIIWYPRDAEEPFRLRWYTPAKVRWG